MTQRGCRVTQAPRLPAMSWRRTRGIRIRITDMTLSTKILGTRRFVRRCKFDVSQPKFSTAGRGFREEMKMILSSTKVCELFRTPVSLRNLRSLPT